MDLNANPNTGWMSIFVDELARSGLEAVCIAPGSRSTPLTLAFANQPAVRIYRHLDERSAAFFALGLAMASGKPVALVCTSGTAAANFHPAVIEAYYSRVPLLVLTADRPAELRGSGANQTIDQIKMYGDHVRWSVEAPTPEANAPDVVLRHLRTLAARAYATADGIVKGPVHLNFPFRKPLEPAGEVNGYGREAIPPATTRPFTRFGRPALMPDTQLIADAAADIGQRQRGLIICGPNCPAGDFPRAVTRLAQVTGFPILADTLSGVRHGDHVSDKVLGGYHLWLATLAGECPAPEVILRFGAVPTSAALLAYLEQAAPDVHYHVTSDGEWADDLHITHTYIQADPARFCDALADELTSAGRETNPAWTAAFVDTERRARAAVDSALDAAPLFDGAAISRLLAALPDDTLVFAGNSMPVRHIDTFDRPSAKRLTVCGNRGASGIDGNVSTALGLAAGSGRRVVAFLGDITFYHDTNGLLAARQLGLDVTFVVTNNDGGSIFYRLPVARHEPPFTELFLTPHGLTFEHAAAMYGLDYAAVTTTAELDELLAGGRIKGSGPRLVEVKTTSLGDFERMSAVAAEVRAAAQAKPAPLRP